VCSGVLYRADGVIVTDWTKADLSRPILRRRISLIVTTRPLEPIDRYPQELTLRMPVLEVVEERMWQVSDDPNAALSIPSRRSHFPHEQIASDLAALLTLLLRRLITVGPLVRILSKGRYVSFPEFPMPILGERAPRVWKPRGGGVTWFAGKGEYTSYE